MDQRSFREELDAFVKQHVFFDHFVLPDYEKFSVRNIASIIGDAFAVNSLVSVNFPQDYVDGFDGVQKVVLVVVDGLGYNRLLSHINRFKGVFSDLAEKGVLKPLTSTFPSTTSTSLTSMFTALPPSEHRIIGFQMFVKEYGSVFNTLDMRPVYGWNQGINIAKEFSTKAKPWVSSLKDHNVKAVTLTRKALIKNGLSEIIYRDQELIPYISESDMVIQCRKVLQQTKPVFLIVYYSGFDALEHMYGPYSEEATSQLKVLESLLKFQLFNKLSNKDKEETLFLMTADHGVSETSKTYFLRDIPEVNDNLLIPPTGDSRAAFLFPKYDRMEKLREGFEKNTEGFRVVSSKELIEKGAFGQVNNPESLQTTVGGLTALSSSNNAALYPYYDEDKTPLGGHGGMTVEESIVPLLSLRLSQL